MVNNQVSASFSNDSEELCNVYGTVLDNDLDIPINRFKLCFPTHKNPDKSVEAYFMRIIECAVDLPKKITLEDAITLYTAKTGKNRAHLEIKVNMLIDNEFRLLVESEADDDWAMIMKNNYKKDAYSISDRMVVDNGIVEYPEYGEDVISDDEY